jgi:hypothetical protein
MANPAGDALTPEEITTALRRETPNGVVAEGR